MDPLICDIYADDAGGNADISALVTAGYPWSGLILKASEGTSYPTHPSSRAWFLKFFPLARSLAGDRYGTSFFRGAYMYWRYGTDPVAQADFFLQLVDEAGGWGPGDLWPMIDVEHADNPSDMSKSAVEDSVTAVAEHLYVETGRQPMLYGGSLMSDLGIVSHMGCSTLMFPRVTSTLPPDSYERIGWRLMNPGQMPSLWSWQLCEDGKCYVSGYPALTPMGAVDYSAIIINGGGQAAIDWTRDNLR